MKPAADKITVEGKLPFAGQRMDFDKSSMKWLMKMLIDAYADKELAVLRELSTNAIDSHIMAGVTDPIQVITPSSLSPYLVIKDTGLGLSVDEVYHLLGHYGASTKRDTNAATGMFGIGSKSPLTYTNQFTLIAIKDGVKAIVAVTREEDGVGNLTVVDTSTTDEPNGVEIKIPAKTDNQFREKAENLFRYWEAGTVLLNGKDPTGLGDMMEVTPTIYLNQGDRYVGNESVVVMGNVPYPAPDLSSSQLNLPHGHSVVAYVPIGSVEIPLNREAIQDAKSTRDTMETVKTEFRNGLKKAVQAAVDRAPTPVEAAKIANKWQTLYVNRTKQQFTYKGKNVPMSLTVPSKDVPNGYGGTRPELTQKMILSSRYEPTSRRRNVTQTLSILPFDQLIQSVFITGFDAADASVTLRKKAAQWYNTASIDEGHTVRHFVWVDWTPEELEFVPADRIVSFDTIKAEVLPKAATYNSGRIPGSFDLVLGGKDNMPNGYVTSPTGVPGDDIDQNFPVFYAWSNQHDATYRLAPVLNGFHDKYTLICLPANRLNKFKRENPKITDATDEIKRLASVAAAKLTQDEKDAIAQSDEGDRTRFNRLLAHKNQIDDSDIKNAIRLSQIPIDHMVKIRDKFRGIVTFSTGNWTDPLDNYPLLSVSYSDPFRSHPDHALRYLNNEYAYRKAHP